MSASAVRRVAIEMPTPVGTGDTVDAGGSFVTFAGNLALVELGYAWKSPARRGIHRIEPRRCFNPLPLETYSFLKGFAAYRIHKSTPDTGVFCNFCWAIFQ